MAEAILTSIGENVELLASAARTTDSAITGSTFRLPKETSAVICVLDVTAAATAVGDLLDVHIESQIDGTNWVDICSFTQVLGDGGAKRHVAKIAKEVAQAMFTDTTLSAGSVRNLLGENIRVVYEVTNAGAADASFTFSVNITPW